MQAFRLVKRDQPQRPINQKPYNSKSTSQNEAPTFTYQVYDNVQDFQIESGIDKNRLGTQEIVEARTRSRHSSIASAFRQLANRTRNSLATNETIKKYAFLGTEFKYKKFY